MTISHTLTAFQAQLLQLAYLFIINICKLLILSGNIHLRQDNWPMMMYDCAYRLCETVKSAKYGLKNVDSMHQ